jgi:hypothetical protein
MQANGPHFSALFSEPSLWKGPVVPFVFGSCYYLAPAPESVLVANAVFFALAAIGLYAGFCYLGAGMLQAGAAVLMWVFYLPHATVFGYYLAEPLIAFLATTAFLFAARAAKTRCVALTFPLGAICGVLLLARAPFVLVVMGLGLLLPLHLPGKRWRAFLLFLAGSALTFSPWTIRNLIVHHEFIPFTIEGGKILFQGVWTPGDDAMMGFVPQIPVAQIDGSLRTMPAFRNLEEGEKGLSPIERYHYWRGLAIKEIKGRPADQVRLCVRKALRFWVTLPTHSWIPNWKMAVVAALCLPLAAVGFWTARRSLLAQLCALFVGGLWLFHALVHAEPRYNFPVMPMMFMLAAVGAEWVYRWSVDWRAATVRVEMVAGPMVGVTPAVPRSEMIASEIQASSCPKVASSNPISLS